MEEPGRLQSMGLLESDTTERLHFHFSLSCTGEGNGNPLQCSSLENPRDGGAWWAAVYGVAQNWTQLKWLSSSSSTIKNNLLFQVSNNPAHFMFNTSSVQFSRSVLSDSLWPHGLQHTRPPCPSPIPWVYSNSCPSSQWCHPIILSSVIPFSCLQVFPASGSFPKSQTRLKWLRLS